MTATTAGSPASSPAASTPSKGLHITLWILQVLLAFVFVMAGFVKVSKPIDELAKTMTWILSGPPGLVRFIGVSELAGALGLILPAATRIKPVLTGVAAVGLTIIMVLAIPVHVIYAPATIAVPIVLGLVAAFVAWGRLKKAPIAPRA